MASPFVLVVLLLVSLAAVSGQTCEELGFTGLALCSDCDTFAEIVKDEELESDCRKCCAQEETNSKVTYHGAILEFCKRRLVFYPNIQAFIDSDLSQYPGLKLQVRYDTTPKLILQDEHGHDKETIGLDNWKTEHIEQFLKQKVKPTSS